MDKRIIELATADEWPHPAGPQPLWQESVVLAFQDVAQRVGGFMRIGHQPNLNQGRLTFGVVSPGNRYTLALEAVPMGEADRSSHAFSIANFLTAEFTATSSRWRASNDDCSIDLTVTNLHPLFDVNALRHGGGEFHKEFNTSHTEMAGLVRGVVRIGAESYQIDGFGFRDHSWGVRNLDNPNALPTNFFWLIGSFGPNLIYSIAEVITLAGERLPLGFVIADGVFDVPLTQDVSFEMELDGMTMRAMKIIFSTQKLGAFEFQVEGFGNVLLSLGVKYLESGMPARVLWGNRVGGGHVSSMFNARAGTGAPPRLFGTSPKNGLYRMPGFRGSWD